MSKFLRRPSRVPPSCVFFPHSLLFRLDLYRVCLGAVSKPFLIGIFFHSMFSSISYVIMGKTSSYKKIYFSKYEQITKNIRTKIFISYLLASLVLFMFNTRQQIIIYTREDQVRTFISSWISLFDSSLNFDRCASKVSEG